MSRITDELDAASERIEESARRVAVASGAIGATTRAIEALSAGADALEVARSVLAGSADGAREVRMVFFDRERGARAYVGPLDGLGEGAIAWEPPLEASYRGHEVFLPKGAGAEPMALALALAGELAPAGEGEEAPNLGVCIAVARRAVVAREGEPFEALLEPESIDALLDAVEIEPAAPPFAPVSTGFGVVAVDREGSLCAATAGDAPSPPVVALRFGRAFLGIAGPGGAEALLLPIVRLVDRAVPVEAALEGVEALGPGELVVVAREDAGGLDARADARGKGAAAVREIAE